MAENKLKSNLQFLNCPDCAGLGKIDGRRCKNCHGISQVAWSGTDLLYWGKEINAWQINQDKAQNLIKNTINIGLIIFGVFGLVLFSWVLFLSSQLGLPVWQFYRWRGWEMLIFWLSLVTDSYLIYRLQRDLERIKHIPKKEYQAQPLVIQPISWPEINNLKSRQKIDVSEYFTAEAVSAIKKAWQQATKYRHEKIEPIHLFVALLTFDQTITVFSRLGASLTALKTKIVHVLSKIPTTTNSSPIIAPAIYQVIFEAYFAAWQLRQKKVGLIELLEVLTIPQNEVREILYDLNITFDKIQNVVAWLRIRRQMAENWQKFRRRSLLRPKNTMNRAMTAVATPILDAFSQDMTLLAQAGYLMPCVGREKEIEEILRIINSGEGRSVILVGNPGVGRTTIIEGLAQRMVAEDVPKILQDKRLVSLSVAKLVSGANAADAEQRLMISLNEVRHSGNIILFIKDIHNMVGITAGREGSIDLAGVLAQVLAHKNILLLSTTTPSDYKKYIEGHSALENALEKISINEVTTNEAIQILEVKAGVTEYQNKIYFSYDAVAEIVNLSTKYLHDRYLPEKAIEILQEVAVKVKETKGKNSLVTANDVAAIISGKTNIPLTQITQAESEKLLNLEEKIHQRIIGQDEAVKMVAASLRRARVEMRDAKRPIANLLFLGPTGVGKTELAKTVAAVYFGDEKNMIRLDMSEYQEKSSLSRLIGAPPGYASANEGGYLTEAVRKNPFSLVLLDEIEKAHPDILNLFLQVMDDGRLTDNSGRTIDFTNTIIIATSNAGTAFIQEKIKQNLSLDQIKQQMIETQLNQYFRLEFLNRFDGIVVFKPLTLVDVNEIAKLMLKGVQANLEEKGIALQVTPQALTELSQAGFDPTFGARPLRRVIQEKVQDLLANQILAGKIGRRDTIILQAGGQVTITKAKTI